MVFFKDTTQMTIPNATAVELNQEDIGITSNLSKFDKLSINNIADNLRRPGRRVLNPNDPNDLNPPVHIWYVGSATP